MRIVIALGGNALLRRGDEMTAANQRENIRIAAKALAPIIEEHEVVISHGNGPQVGLLSLQSAAYKEVEEYPLDILQPHRCHIRPSLHAKLLAQDKETTVYIPYKRRSHQIRGQTRPNITHACPARNPP